MKQIAIVTDSNSGITQAEAKELGIYVLPMPFFINEKLFFEEVTLSQEQFYEYLSNDADISTSQPAPGDVLDLWKKILKDFDELVHIPMSSGLSSSCETAHALSAEFNGRVHVVNNQRISVTQRQSVLDALELKKRGKTAKEIKDILELIKNQSSIYITVETLKYLKKGGRITPAAATIGSILNIKPVLQIQGEKLDAYAKTRGKKAARKTMLEAMNTDLNGRFQEDYKKKRIHLQAAYTGNLEEALDWKKELEQNFPDFPIHMDPLSLSVSCHIGKGALAIAASVFLPDQI